MSLYESTKDLHHACEAHPVGTRMANGSVTPVEWAYWLLAFKVIHLVVDPKLDPEMSRDASLSADLATLPVQAPSLAALRFAASLHKQDVTGAAYVLHGAHRSGGRVMAPRMAKRGFPSAHTIYKNPTNAQDWVKSVRSKLEFVDQTKDTFACLLSVMDEIEEGSCLIQ